MRSRCRVGIHLIWATKGRHPWLSDAVRPRVCDLLGRIAAKRRCPPLAIGGWVDHVHLYLTLSPQIAIVALVNALKANSTTWIHQSLPGLDSFEWQRGYSAAGVDPRDDEALRSYIEHQDSIHEARHRHLTAPPAPKLRPLGLGVGGSPPR